MTEGGRPADWEPWSRIDRLDEPFA